MQLILSTADLALFVTNPFLVLAFISNVGDALILLQYVKRETKRTNRQLLTFSSPKHKGMELWVHGGSTGGQRIRITFVTIPNKVQIPLGTSTTTKGPTVFLADLTSSGIPANAWVKVLILLS